MGLVWTLQVVFNVGGGERPWLTVDLDVWIPYQDR